MLALSGMFGLGSIMEMKVNLKKSYNAKYAVLMSIYFKRDL
jgi:hypothetical protein